MDNAGQALNHVMPRLDERVKRVGVSLSGGSNHVLVVGDELVEQCITAGGCCGCLFRRHADPPKVFRY